MADVPLMAGKFVLVTGGTGGIGRATAIGLAALGARVGITGRDRARAEAAAAGIRAAPGSPAVDAFAADMSAQAGVRHLAARWRTATRGWTCWSTTSAGSGLTGTSPPMAWSALSRSTTSRRSC
jgi:NAD(P)-dependent dehydrogenase (short-subunit alcohol dehydrogenase family)